MAWIQCEEVTKEIKVKVSDDGPLITHRPVASFHNSGDRIEVIKFKDDLMFMQDIKRDGHSWHPMGYIPSSVVHMTNNLLFPDNCD